MNLNATLIGQIYLPLILVITGLIAWQARKKSDSAISLTIAGFLLAFIPPLNLILLAILALKAPRVQGPAPEVQ
ncbi:hypothetical protein [Ferrimonas marina]|uniref:Uncharacterized protein n=1 Tax=Ferrimonas marina TaxID=299255 RepID=A0A1M5YTY1_9GAMM|nr:hypothetical protein [Ferrimonas marina]SHI15274.1 hypothetical protein SAMN02745129_4413 [Ferrimonas marina]